MSFEDLKEKYNIPQKHFFKFLHIRIFISRMYRPLCLPSLSSVEEIAKHKSMKGLISRFYKLIMDGCKTSSESRRLAWREDLNGTITAEEWQKICLKAQTQSINTHFKLIQFKWLMRTYVTPTLLNKFNPHVPDTCVKCGMKGTLFHCLWERPGVQIFWKEALDTILNGTG